MPFYDHKCQSCAAKFEAFRPMARSSEDADCPVCGQSAPRVITAPFVDVKGNDTDQARRKKEGDAKITRLSSRARDLGNAGHIPKDDPIVRFDDKRLDPGWTPPKEKPKDPA